MYVPLGGAKWRLLNVWPIFTFVALWHDFEWHLLKWAWLMAVLVAPEALCRHALRAQVMQQHRGQAWLQHVCAAFTSCYITVCRSHASRRAQ
jgi:protein-cysteine N-palmitoyltransferase HHAT